ncbi:MAG: 2-dehydropantoate 2-reductase [Thermoplasmatales archaeon]|nr:MAG: 2-dehydropantoate 2-reductase [Thermoplasmatales archaeon]
MNIIIVGAGAIGSLFGGLLSQKNNVILVGRKPHVDSINSKGLSIQGKTKLNIKICATNSIGKVPFSPDLLILSVKSYDTENAVKDAKSLIHENTVVMSLQNGLDNIEKIKKYVNIEKIIICITTHGVIFSKPGVIKHTGFGKTTLGNLTNKNIQIIKDTSIFLNEAGIKTTITNNIIEEMWSKAIINSSINPLTALLKCKNGYLLKNKIIEKLVEKICEESTIIANNNGVNISAYNAIKKTKEVITETTENHSSMLQSVLQGKKTEIDSINGVLVKIGKKHNIKTVMNEFLIDSIKLTNNGSNK